MQKHYHIVPILARLRRVESPEQTWEFPHPGCNPQRGSTGVSSALMLLLLPKESVDPGPEAALTYIGP